MENIYFQPNKENSEFLAKLEKLDEYTIPQILERMVDHFRNLPELEDALNKLGIKTDSLEEELDDDIRVEERFWVGGKPKKLRHFKGDNPTPILSKEWYINGQLKVERYQYFPYGKIKGGDIESEFKSYFENGQINTEGKQYNNRQDYKMMWNENGQLSYDKQNNLHYDKDGNEIDAHAWGEIRKEIFEKGPFVYEVSSYPSPSESISGVTELAPAL